MENLTPCKIENLDQIDTQFVSVDYFGKRNIYSTFGENLCTGPSGQSGEKI